jgi:cysteine-rich repeat protein
MTNLALRRLKVAAIIIAIILVASIGSLIVYSNSALYAQISSFVRKNVSFREYAVAINFNNPHYFTYDVTAVRVDKDGARLINNAQKSDLILINVLKIDPDSQVVGFKENAVKDRDSSITYQISSDYKQWYYYDGRKWSPAGDCKSCTNNAIAINQNIKKFPVNSDGLLVKAFLQSTSGDLVLNSVNLTIKGQSALKAEDVQPFRASFANKASAAPSIDSCDSYCQSLGSASGSCESSCDVDETHENGGDQFCSSRKDCCCKIPPAPTPNANPTLPESCGLDIVLVLDSSDSIDNTELGQVKSAGNAFVDALAGTPTNFAVVDFDTQIVSSLALTNNTTAVHSAINNIGHTSQTELTNWEAALIKGQSLISAGTSSKPNLMVIITDGDPTTYGYPNSLGSYGGTEPDPPDINNAILAANAAKIAGTRILAIGVTSEPTIDNLKAISGPNVNTDNLNTDVITTDFAALFAELKTYAQTLCGGTITVNKYLNIISPETRAGAGWTYNVAGTTKITDSSGQTGAVEVAVGSGYSVIENTVLSGFSFLSAACYKQDQTPVGSTTANGVDNITINNEDIIYCNFVNQTNCGNGQLNNGEECDDGNTNNGDGCNNQCQNEGCGDGVVQENLGEQCDDSNTNSGDGCSDRCKIEFCGDGIKDANGPDNLPDTADDEKCDDGNTLNGDGCSGQCIIESCGDGYMDLNGADNIQGTNDDEQCDDGNNNQNDYCNNQCLSQLPICHKTSSKTNPYNLLWVDNSAYQPHIHHHGDILENVGDINDDGEINDDDCILLGPQCGNNILEEGEECDGTGGPVNPQWCSGECVIIPGCGNARLENGEECDDGNIQDGDGCSSQCINDASPVCGNNIWQQGEECDGTGGPVNPQWCTAQCTIIAHCGNNHIDEGEQCDDGNNQAGDSCNANCSIENPFFALSVCYLGLPGTLPSYAKLGYRASDMPASPTINTNTVDNGSSVVTTPQGIPVGSNSSQVWSTNNYRLNDNSYQWTLKIDGNSQSQEIDSYGSHEPEYYDNLRCQSECGNNILEAEEECDDGNNADGDGCSAACQWEWDLSEIVAGGECVQGSATFVITNNGEPFIGDMVQSREYRIYRNNILENSGTFLLAGEQSMTIDGSVYSGLNNIGSDLIRLEADQSLGYPGQLNNPAYAIVLCAMDGINAIDDSAATSASAPPLKIDILSNDFYDGLCSGDNQTSCINDNDCAEAGGTCDGNESPILPGQVTIAILTPPSQGNLSVGAETGIATYIPDGCGSFSFVYKICDNELTLMCDTAMVNIVVTGCGGGGGGGDYCGDGQVKGTEQCENNSQCSANETCKSCQCVGTPPPGQVSYCGDGIIDSGEECDDGDNVDGDGCSAVCRYEPIAPPIVPPELVTTALPCGNGTVETALGETCDDGNAISGDGCSATCVAEVCGDGIVQAALGETCEPPRTATCSATCRAIVPGSVTGLTCIDYTIRDGAGNLTAAIAPYYNGATNQLDNFPITGLVTLPTGTTLTGLSYSINGGLSYRDVPATSVATRFSIPVNPPFRVGASYSVLVRATFSNGSIATSALCPVSFIQGCLVFEGNEFSLNAQPSPLSSDGYVQFISGEAQSFHVGALCNDYALVRNIQTGQQFPLNQSPVSPDTGNRLDLWQTNNISFINGTNSPVFYDLEMEIGNRLGGKYTRRINSVVVSP